MANGIWKMENGQEGFQVTLPVVRPLLVEPRVRLE
jgi:hypothetical protein